MPIPALPAGQKPNFIVILTDDQGWDDIGLHNPNYVNTPNLDRFIKGGTFFSNFYVTPQCAQTRAALMTGRQYPRTGTMLVHAGARQQDGNIPTIFGAPYAYSAFAAGVCKVASSLCCPSNTATAALHPSLMQHTAAASAQSSLFQAILYLPARVLLQAGTS